MKKNKKSKYSLILAATFALVIILSFLWGLNSSTTVTGQAILKSLNTEDFAFAPGEHFFVGNRPIPFHKGDSVMGDRIYLNYKNYEYKDSYIENSPSTGFVIKGIINPTSEEKFLVVTPFFFEDYDQNFYGKTDPLRDRPNDVLSSAEMNILYHESFSNF